MNFASENVKVSNDSLDCQFFESEGVNLKQYLNFWHGMIAYVIYISVCIRIIRYEIK